MDAAAVVVTGLGSFLVVFILWFFFGPKKVTTAKANAGGLQEVEVTVRGAYTPDRIEVEAGRPVRLNFRREEENACTAEVIIPDFGIVKGLPYQKTTSIDFTPGTPGDYPFHCGMNMVRGRLIVRPSSGAARGDGHGAAH